MISKYKKILAALPQEVTLVTVSKTQAIESIKNLYDNGCRVFGENKVQELVLKEQQLPKDIQWHFIGHLQTNKVKQIAPFVHFIHAVDSLKLLKEISKQAIKNQRNINCLLQIKIAKEENKYGLLYDEVLSVLENNKLEGVNIMGLMGMATHSDEKKEVEGEFQQLHQFYEQLKQDYGFTQLSMGMSNDYEIAVNNGSTMVRVGSAIFK